MPEAEKKPWDQIPTYLAVLLLGGVGTLYVMAQSLSNSIGDVRNTQSGMQARLESLSHGVTEIKTRMDTRPTRQEMEMAIKNAMSELRLKISELEKK